MTVLASSFSRGCDAVLRLAATAIEPVQARYGVSVPASGDFAGIGDHNGSLALEVHRGTVISMSNPAPM